MNGPGNSVTITIGISPARKLEYTVGGTQVTGDVFARNGNDLIWECAKKFDLDITNFTQKPANFPKASPKGQFPGSPFSGSSYSSSAGGIGEQIAQRVTTPNHGSYKYKLTVKDPPTPPIEDDPLIIVE